MSLIKKVGRDRRIKLTKKLNYHINEDEKFKGRHTNGPEGAFTRNRLLPFNYLIVSILKMGKSGLQWEMDSFLRETEDAEFNIRQVTKSAFSQARKNLSPEAFLD